MEIGVSLSKPGVTGPGSSPGVFRGAESQGTILILHPLYCCPLWETEAKIIGRGKLEGTHDQKSWFKDFLTTKILDT